MLTIKRSDSDGAVKIAGVRIRDKYNRTLAYIGARLPLYLRERLFDKLEAVFPGAIREIDTREEGIDNQFECLHFAWYNRSTTRVSQQFQLVPDASN